MTSIGNKTRLAFSIASVLGLAACGGGADNNTAASSSSPAVETAAPSTQAPAQIQVGVRFPDAEASAAWLGDTAQVEINFHTTADIDSWPAAQAVVAQYETCQLTTYPDGAGLPPDCTSLSDSDLKGSVQSTLLLTRDTPLGYLDVPPGSYRVEARFLRSDDTLNETSVSYVNLTAGAHTLRLRGLAANWTLDQALTLQLLGSSDLESDWDPTTAGNQTPVEALGLTGGLLGLQLPSAQTFAAQPNADQLALVGSDIAVQAGKLSPASVSGDDLSTLFQPVLRMSAAGGGEDLSGPRFRSDVTAYASTVADTAVTTNQTYSVASLPATLRQSYNSSGNHTALSLGGRYVSFDRVNIDSGSLARVNSTRNRAELLLGVATTDAPAAYEILDFSSHNTVYWDVDQTDWVTPSADLVIATIAKTSPLTDTWLDVFTALQGSANSVQSGSEIQGYLIEHLYSYTRIDQGMTGDDAQIPARYLDASLQQIAVQEGLMAAAAEDNCQTYGSHRTAGLSTQYRWDDSNQRWVAGTYNHLISGADILRDIDAKVEELTTIRDNLDPNDANYSAYQAAYQDAIDLHDVTFRQEVLLKADLNGDGKATLFEEGVFIASGNPQADCDLTSRLSDDGTTEILGMDCERVDVASTDRTSVTEQNGAVCVQPFTLRASQLGNNLFPWQP